MSILFIIKCQEDKYYLGLTNNFVSIFFTHFENHNNILWLNIYKPIAILHIKQFFDVNMLDDCVIHYMYIYGIENVRGGIYDNLIFNLTQYKEITDKIYEIYNV